MEPVCLTRMTCHSQMEVKGATVRDCQAQPESHLAEWSFHGVFSKVKMMRKHEISKIMISGSLVFSFSIYVSYSPCQIIICLIVLVPQ